jgi:hypothetical protein
MSFFSVFCEIILSLTVIGKRIYVIKSVCWDDAGNPTKNMLGFAP